MANIVKLLPIVPLVFGTGAASHAQDTLLQKEKGPKIELALSGFGEKGRETSLYSGFERKAVAFGGSVEWRKVKLLAEKTDASLWSFADDTSRVGAYPMHIYRDEFTKFSHMLAGFAKIFEVGNGHEAEFGALIGKDSHGKTVYSLYAIYSSEVLESVKGKIRFFANPRLGEEGRDLGLGFLDYQRMGLDFMVEPQEHFRLFAGVGLRETNVKEAEIPGMNRTHDRFMLRAGVHIPTFMDNVECEAAISHIFPARSNGLFMQQATAGRFMLIVNFGEK